MGLPEMSHVASSDVCFCLAESVYKVVLKRSSPAPIRQLVLYISDDKGSVDGSVRELAFAKRLHERFL